MNTSINKTRRIESSSTIPSDIDEMEIDQPRNIKRQRRKKNLQ